MAQARPVGVLVWRAGVPYLPYVGQIGFAAGGLKGARGGFC